MKRQHHYHVVGGALASATGHGRGRGWRRRLLVAVTVLAHVLAITSFALTTVAMRRMHSSLQVGTFASHPFLMSFAFAVCSTFGVLAYGAYERLLGVSHVAAKFLHLAWNTVALATATVGFSSMYHVHALAGRHFQSLHSWLGVAVFAACWLQYVVGAGLFLLPRVPDDLKRRLLPTHVFLGVASLFGVYVVILLGLIYNNPGVNGDQPAYTAMNWAGVSLFGTALCVGYVLSQKRPAQAAATVAKPVTARLQGGAAVENQTV